MKVYNCYLIDLQQILYIAKSDNVKQIDVKGEITVFSKWKFLCIFLNISLTNIEIISFLFLLCSFPTKKNHFKGYFHDVKSSRFGFFLSFVTEIRVKSLSCPYR